MVLSSSTTIARTPKTHFIRFGEPRGGPPSPLGKAGVCLFAPCSPATKFRAERGLIRVGRNLAGRGVGIVRERTEVSHLFLPETEFRAVQSFWGCRGLFSKSPLQCSHKAITVYFLITSTPRYFFSTSGTLTEPSAFWFCSTRAGRMRLVARPEPFKVWRYSILPSARLTRI